MRGQSFPNHSNGFNLPALDSFSMPSRDFGRSHTAPSASTDWHSPTLNAVITGDGTNETLVGTGQADTIDGQGGDDKLYGLHGNDTLIGGEGDDTLYGGNGTDTADYSGAGNAGVTVDLSMTTAQDTGAAGMDTLSSIENVIGSAGGDTITGTDDVNSLSGGGGADTLKGAGGDDFLQGGGGGDTLAGGDGFDLVSYLNSHQGVNVNLTSHKGHHGEAQGDMLNSIEGSLGPTTPTR